jgi:hypothetical protein
MKRSGGWDKWAEGRAALEKPPSPSVQEQILALGPRRQLTMRQYHRILSALLLFALLLQIALLVFFGAVSALISGGLILLIGGAVTVYFNGRVILKVREDLPNSQRSLGVLVAFMATAVLLRDTRPPISRLLALALTDIGSLVAGIVIVAMLRPLDRRTRQGV